MNLPMSQRSAVSASQNCHNGSPSPPPAESVSFIYVFAGTPPPARRPAVKRGSRYGVHLHLGDRASPVLGTALPHEKSDFALFTKHPLCCLSNKTSFFCSYLFRKRARLSQRSQCMTSEKREALTQKFSRHFAESQSRKIFLLFCALEKSDS